MRWGLALLATFLLSLYQYGTTGRVTWVMDSFQATETGARRLLAQADLIDRLPLPRAEQPARTEPVVEISFSAPAFDISGRVVRVIDGETIEVLDATNRTHKVRLHGIDTPERGQPYGRAAQRELSRLIAGEGVGIDVRDTDRYGRTVGVVYQGNCNINLSMVQSGFAWWYKRYAPFDDDLREAQQRAQARGLGLWAEPDPVPPWEWRRKQN